MCIFCISSFFFQSQENRRNFVCEVIKNRIGSGTLIVVIDDVQIVFRKVVTILDLFPLESPCTTLVGSLEPGQ